MKKNKLAQGVALLTLSNLIVKAAGLLFKIPLTALIGEEGMGYFNSAYTLFTWFYMISTAGLPVAASMLISRRRASENKSVSDIFTVCLAMFTVIGVLGSLLLFFGAEMFASVLKVEKSSIAIAAIAPTLFFICQSAALRGYFQGIGYMTPHAVSQIIEALGKLFLGVAFAKLALDRGLGIYQAAGYAASGLTVGIAAGMITLYLSFIFNKPEKLLQPEESRKSIALRLLKTAIPITLSSSVMSLTGILDTFIMTRRLHDIGFSQTETIAIYGNYSSLAVPMFNLPPVLIYPMTYALMPALSEAIAKGDMKRAHDVTSKTIRAASFVAIPASVGLCLLSNEILSLFFAEDLVARGSGMLRLLAPSSYFICFLALTNTVLQAYGKEKIPLFAMLAGSVVKLISSWTLIPIIGKYGAPASTFLCYAVICVISVHAIASKTEAGRDFSPNNMSKPLVASAVMGVVAVILKTLLPSDKIYVFINIAVSAGVYCLIAIASGAIEIPDKFKKHRKR